jgi:hypothetical protein
MPTRHTKEPNSAAMFAVIFDFPVPPGRRDGISFPAAPAAILLDGRAEVNRRVVARCRATLQAA